MGQDVTQNIGIQTNLTSTGGEKVNADMMKLQKNIVNMSRLMSKNMREGFQKLENQQKQMNKTNKIASENTEKYRKSMMGLRRAMISFFFITKQMGNMLSPAAELVGLFDIWNTILVVTFLPAMLWLLEKVFLPMLDFFLKLPEPVKLVIGLLTVLGIVGGVVALAVALLGAPFVAIFAAIAVAVAVVIIIFNNIKKSWDDMVNAIAGSGLATWFTNLWEGIKTGFSNAINWLVSKASELGSSIGDALWDALPKWLQKIITGFSAGVTSIAAMFQKDEGTPSGGMLGNFPKNETAPGGNEGMSKLPGLAEKPVTIGELMGQSVAPEGFHDMIWRAGKPPISIDPNDTLIAGKNPNGGTLGALGGGTNIVQNIYVTASNKDEISRMIQQNNKSLVMDIKRMVGS